MWQHGEASFSYEDPAVGDPTRNGIAAPALEREQHLCPTFDKHYAEVA